jgi:hypothetical protein
MRRVWIALGLSFLAGPLSSCAQLGPSTPTTQPAKSMSPTSFSSAAATASPSVAAVRRISPSARATTAQLGVQIYWHEVNDAYATKSNADRLFDYVVSLGANSVGVSFPLYTDGARPTKVYTKAGVTPTPESLQILIREAKARDLRIMIRPLIDEKNIDDNAGAWRGSIKPGNMAAWFTSYRQALLPFLTAAQAAHADMFVLGSELDSLVGQAAQWRTLEAAAAAVFDGHLAYADNWGQWATGRPGVPGAEPGLDAYPQLHLPDSATPAQIKAAWTTWLQKRPADLAETVLQEVGIAATPGAYKEPAAWARSGQTVAPQIQANWFAGACGAAQSLHMSGIYFWNLDAWADPAKAASYDTASFIGRGDSAIKACFAQGWPGQ